MHPHFAAFLVLAALPLAAQTSRATTTYDVNGNAVAGPTLSVSGTPGSTQVTERMVTLNGRSVPVDKVEEHVLKNDSTGTKVERLIKRFDQTGSPLPPEKVIIEEEKHGDGSSTVHTTVMKGDISGNLALAERTTTQVQKSGTSTMADTTIERPSINGSFDVAEKRTTRTDTSPDGARQDTLVQRRKQDGSFYDAVKEVKEQRKQGDKTVENATLYSASADGRMSLEQQTVTTATKAADGSQRTEVNIYTPSVPGLVDSPGAPRLQEQRITDRTMVGKDTVKESFSVRRPSLDDPTRMGDLRKISDTVCKGKCDP